MTPRLTAIVSGILLLIATAVQASNFLITSPVNGAVVSGTVTIKTAESADVSWINVFVDGDWVASNPASAERPYSVKWKSTRVDDGTHVISATGYNSHDNPFIYANPVNVNVMNGIAASPSPSATQTQPPTASPSPVPSSTQSSQPTVTASSQPTVIVTATVQPTQPPSSSPSPVATATPVGSGILYYVAPTGADNNPGTASLPWLTIQHAVSAMARFRLRTAAARCG